MSEICEASEDATLWTNISGMNHFRAKRARCWQLRSMRKMIRHCLHLFVGQNISAMYESTLVIHRMTLEVAVTNSVLICHWLCKFCVLKAVKKEQKFNQRLVTIPQNEESIKAPSQLSLPVLTVWVQTTSSMSCIYELTQQAQLVPFWDCYSSPSTLAAVPSHVAWCHMVLRQRLSAVLCEWRLQQLPAGARLVVLGKFYPSRSRFCLWWLWKTGTCQPDSDGETCLTCALLHGSIILGQSTASAQATSSDAASNSTMPHFPISSKPVPVQLCFEARKWDALAPATSPSKERLSCP